MPVPTVASGWADWADSHEDQQRVGLVHATVNVTAVLLYGGALLARRRGGTGHGLSVAGGAVIAVGALLGGHLGVNLRAATLLGIVGAGGIGFYLLNASRIQEFGVVTTIMLLVFAAVLLVELLALWLRRVVH